MRPRGDGRSLRGVLLFGLLSGCFTCLVSVGTCAALALSGWFSLGRMSEAIYWVLGIFVFSFVTTVLAILVLESFCEP